MLRNLFRFLIVIAVLAFVRAVIGLITRAISQAVNEGAGEPEQPQKAARPQEATPRTGELKKDPVCGVYVPAATAPQLTSGGETHYFCSQECKEKYSRAHA